MQDEAAEEEYDRLRRRVLWTMPSGLYVLGTTDGAERRNGMTITRDVLRAVNAAPATLES